MTGPDHYREAERLLAKLPESTAGGAYERSLLGEAQVHATLALAAATAANIRRNGALSGTGTSDSFGWAEAISNGEVVTPNGQ